MLTIDWAGEEFDLYAERALLWKRARTLIVADPHFGKSAAFRALGVPVPRGATQHDLDRLSRLLERSQAKRMILLGDFLHARHGRARATMSTLQAWRQQHATLEIILVRGNHDQHAGDPPASWRFNCVDEPFRDHPLRFRHTPETHDDVSLENAAASHSGVIAGHVHPCAVLHDVDGSAARVACFYFTPRCAILPAFGSFTGMHRVRPGRGDRVFALADGMVVEVQGVESR